MQIQVNTDNHIAGSDELTHRVEALVEAALDRFKDRITRVEVHLNDQSSSAKAGGDDKRCVMEARLGGLQPITASHQSASLEQALDGAAGKLQRSLERTLGRLDDPKGRTSFGRDQPI
jgi:ribosome-associated translation inhibitor RaiA